MSSSARSTDFAFRKCGNVMAIQTVRTALMSTTAAHPVPAVLYSSNVLMETVCLRAGFVMGIMTVGIWAMKETVPRHHSAAHQVSGCVPQTRYASQRLRCVMARETAPMELTSLPSAVSTTAARVKQLLNVAICCWWTPQTAILSLSLSFFVLLDEDDCQVNNGGCSHGCIQGPFGAQCTCDPGFQLLNDSKTCDDINECLIPGFCSQTCFNERGSFRCYCQDGYQLEPDGRTCKATCK